MTPVFSKAKRAERAATTPRRAPDALDVLQTMEVGRPQAAARPKRRPAAGV
jgi:hypothetical protein